MDTRGVTLQLPISVSDDEAKLLFALKLYEVGKATLGQAAQLSGFSKRAFMEFLGQHKIPIFDYPAEELEQEIQS